MHLLLLNLRSPGGGTTTYTNELCRWLVANDHTVTHKSCKLTKKEAAQYEQVQDLKDLEAAIQAADAVLINTGSNKHMAPDELELITRVLPRYKRKITYLCHDIFNTERYYNRYEFLIQNSAKQLSSSPVSHFIKRAKALGGQTGIFLPALDFNRIRAKHWVPIYEQDATLHRMIGRNQTYKGFPVLYEFFQSTLKPNNQRLVVEGIDRSPAYISFKAKYEFTPGGPQDPVAPGELMVCGPYQAAEALDRMARSAFGYQLSGRPAEFVGDHLEYTHMELIATGTTIVLNPSWFQNHQLSYLLYDPLLVWLHPTDHARTWNSILENQDSGIRETNREFMFEQAKSMYDAEVVFPTLLKELA